MAQGFEDFFASGGIGNAGAKKRPTDEQLAGYGYSWAGPFAAMYYGTGMQMYSYDSDNFYKGLIEKKKEEEKAVDDSNVIREGIYGALESLPGARIIGAGLTGLGEAAEWVGEKLPGIKGFTNEAQDFFNYAAYATPRGIADAVGGAIEFGSRFVGETEYRGTPLQAQRYNYTGQRENVTTKGTGVGEWLGQYSDDIAMTFATAGLGTASLAARGGQWAVRSIPQKLAAVSNVLPIATRAERVGALGASVASNLYSGTSQLGAGNISPWQLTAQIAVDAPFDMLTGGQFGKGRLANIAYDAATGGLGAAVSGAVPFAFDQEGYTMQDYLAQTALGAGIGTAIGVGTNLGRVSAQERLDAQAIRQQAREGKGTMPRPDAGLTPEEIQVQSMIQQAPSQGAPAQPTMSRYASDAVLRKEIPADEDVERSAAIERNLYVNELMQKVPPQVLVDLLDLEVDNIATLTPGELKSKVINEWVYQAANGKGIDGIEQRLQQAGIEAVGQQAQDYTQNYAGTFQRPAQPEIPQAPVEEAAVAGMPPQPVAEAPGIVQPIVPPRPVGPEMPEMADYNRGMEPKSAQVLSVDDDGNKTIEVDAADVKTTVPPSVAKKLAGLEDEYGNLVTPEEAFIGPAGRDDIQVDSPRATEDVVVYRDAEDGNYYAIDGRKNLINATNETAPFDIIRDPETGQLKLDLEGTQPDAEKIYDKKTRKLKAKLVEGGPEEAVKVRTGNNEELKAEAPAQRKPDPEPKNAADAIAKQYAAGKEPEVAARAVAEDATDVTKDAQKASNWYRKKASNPEASSSASQSSTLRTSYSKFKDELILQANFLKNEKGLLIAVEPGSAYRDTAGILDDIENNAVIRVSESTAPDGHPLAEQSAVRASDGTQLTYDQLLQASYAVNGLARTQADINSVAGISDAWDKYSRMFPAKAWPAVATETKAFKLAQLDDPEVPRIPALASRDIATPTGVATTLVDRVDLSTTQPVATQLDPISSLSPEGRAVARLVNSIMASRDLAQMPLSGVKKKAQDARIKAQESFAEGSATEEINITAKNRSKLFNDIADSAGVLPGEMVASIKAGVREFGPIKVLDVVTKKSTKGVEDVYAKFQLDINAIRNVEKYQSVADMVAIGKSHNDAAEVAALRSFEDTVNEATQRVAYDVTPESLLEIDIEAGDASVAQKARARDQANWESNSKFRQSYDKVSNALADSTGIRPVAARLFVLKQSSVSLEEDLAADLKNAVDKMLTEQEQRAAQEWLSNEFRNNTNGARGYVKMLYDAGGTMGDNGLRDLRSAAQVVADIDRTVKTIANTVDVPEQVLLGLLDNTIKPGEGISSQTLSSAQNLLRKNSAMHAAFQKAKDDFEIMQNYTMVRDIRTANAENNNPKPIKARNIRGPLGSIVGGAAWYVLDNTVQEFEDDELYLGIPGSVWKKASGGGGYAAAMFGLPFLGRKATKPGATNGWGRKLRAAEDQFNRDLSKSFGVPSAGLSTESRGPLTATERLEKFRSDAIERLTARGINPDENPAALETEIATGISMYEYLGGDKTVAGDFLTKWVAGLTSVSKISQGFSDIISKTRDVIQLKTKDKNDITDQVAERVLKLNKRFPDGKHIDAAIEFDYRMTAVRNMQVQAESGTLSVENVDWEGMRENVRNGIRNKYFMVKDKNDPTKMVLDRAGYAAYLDMQRSMNRLREEDIKYHVMRSIGAKDPTDVDGTYADLTAERSLVLASIGSLTDQLEVSELNLGVAKAKYAEAYKSELQRLGMEKKDFDVYVENKGAVSTEYQEALDSMNGAKLDVNAKRRELNRDQAFHEDIKLRMSKIEDLPRMISISKRDGYLPRPRNGRAKYVLRVKAEDVGINVRLEMDDASEINRQKMDILREVAVKRAAKQYSPFYKGEFGKMPAGVTPESIQKMSDSELISTLMDNGKVYYRTYDQLSTGRRVKSSRQAESIIAEAIHLVESGANASSVLRKTIDRELEKDILDDLVGALDDKTEFSIDHEELKKSLLESGAYKEIVARDKKSYIVDIAEVGRLAKRLMVPPNPNLTRRANVAGYYNPDWTAAEKMMYFGQQVETMRYNITDGIARIYMNQAIDRFMEIANKYNVDNPTVEWVRNYRQRVAGMAYEDNSIKQIADIERIMRQYISGSTLTGNVNAALQNRFMGMAAAYASSRQAMRKQNGAKRYDANGNVVEEIFFNSKLESDEFLQKQGIKKFDVREDLDEQNFNGWVPTSRYVAAPFRPFKMASTAISFMAPETMMKRLASGSPMWSAVYQEIKRRDLQDATFTGSISQSNLGERRLASIGKKMAYYLTEKTERANNMASLLAFTDVAMRQYGISDADFKVMSPAQQQEVILRIAKTTADGRRILAEKSVVDGTATMDDDIRRSALEKILGEAEAGRRMTQGGYSKYDKTALENKLDTIPGGIIMQTFMAPVLRAVDLSVAMTVGVLKEQGGINKSSIRAFAPIMAGYGVMMALVGADATPFYGDAMLALEAAHAVQGALDSEESRRKRSTKQFWEDMAGSAFERAGLGYKTGQEYVRALMTEGLIRHYADVAVGYEGSVAGSMMPAGPSFINSTATSLIRFGNDLFAEDKTLFEALYRNKRLALGTQFTKAVDVASQIGAGWVKLDNFGNPIIDPRSGMPINYSTSDGIKQFLFGKSFNDIRTSSAKYEGYIPLYSDYDKMNYMRSSIKSTKFVRFGADRQQEDAIVISMWQDAAKIDRDISKMMSSKEVRQGISEGKKIIDDLLRYDKPLTSDGKKINQIVAEIQARGLYDPSGRNNAKVKDNLYGYIEDMYLAAATQKALSANYGRMVQRDPEIANVLGPTLPYEITDSEMKTVMSGQYPPGFNPQAAFALLKLRKMYSGSSGLYSYPEE